MITLKDLIICSKCGWTMGHYTPSTGYVAECLRCLRRVTQEQLEEFNEQFKTGKTKASAQVLTIKSCYDCQHGFETADCDDCFSSVPTKYRKIGSN